MKKETIRQFLMPDRKKILFFGIFMFIAFAGHTQSWVFSGKDAGLPKPPLFDLLKPFPFWMIWVLLLLPLGILSKIIVVVGGYGADFIMRGPFWLFWIIQSIYFYTVSCMINFIWSK